MLSGEVNENGEKKHKRLISKKTTLHAQHTFFVHFFSIVLQDYNVKSLETSWLHDLWRKCRTCSCSLFFSLPLNFSLVAASISHFLTAATISCCSSNKKMTPYLSLQLSVVFFLLSVIRWAVAYFLFFSVFLFLYIQLI